MPLTDLLRYDFLRYALISGLLLGPTCAMLGVFVNLRGMAFFSDALAHSAITGVAIGLLINAATGWSIEPTFYLLIFSCILALAMGWFSQRSPLPRDTITAFTFSGSVALGVILISVAGQQRMLEGLLFGSIFSNNPAAIARQAILAAIVLAFFLTQLRPLTLATLDPELARARGHHPAILHYAFSLLVAATVAIGLNMLGALLLSALIVIPAAAARLATNGFRPLIILTLIIGLLAPPIGIAASATLNLPTGPTIVLTNIAILILCQTIHLTRNRNQTITT